MILGLIERRLRWPSPVVGEVVYKVLMPVFFIEHVCGVFYLTERNPSWYFPLFLVAILEDICVCYLLAFCLSFPLKHIHSAARVYNTFSLCVSIFPITFITMGSALLDNLAGVRLTRLHMTEIWSNGALRVLDMASDLDLPNSYRYGFLLGIGLTLVCIVTTVSNSSLKRNRSIFITSNNSIICLMMIAFVLFDYGCKDIIESIPAYSSRYGSSAVHVVDNTILSSVFVPFKWGRSTRLEILKIASDKQPVAYKSLLSALESSSVLGTGSCLDRMVHGYMGKKVLSMRNEDIRPNVIVFTIETMRAYENSGLRVPMYNGTTVSLTPNLDRLRSRGADWRNFYTVNVNSPGAYYAQEHGHYNDGGGHTYDERLHGYTEVLDNMGYEMYRLTPDGFASSPGYQKVPYPNKVTAYLGEWGGWFTSKDILLKHPMVKAISKHKKKHGDDPYYLEVRTPGGTHIMWQLFEDSEKEFSEEFTAGLEQLREKAMNEVFPTADGVHHKDYYKVEDKNELYRDMLKTYWLADQFIGKTLDDLRAKGLAKNTLVIVQGDHGHGLEHGVATVPMREQYHVPFVVSDVDDDVIHSSTRNITNKEVSSNLDFGATLLDLLNAPGYVTDGIGHSLNRKMNSKGNKRHIVSRHGGEWIVRNQTHTMNFYPSGSLVDIKVWDTSIDPYQQYAPHVYSVPNTDDIHLHWLHTYREMSLLWEKSIESCGQHFNQTPTVQ